MTSTRDMALGEKDMVEIKTGTGAGRRNEFYTGPGGSLCWKLGLIDVQANHMSVRHSATRCLALTSLPPSFDLGRTDFIARIINALVFFSVKFVQHLDDRRKERSEDSVSKEA